MPGTLYLVATPIGNLQDMTFRAIETLRNVDLIACEDTRHTRKLLNHFQIAAKLISFHEHNEAERAVELGRQLSEGSSIAVVTDAGTPAINDPGARLVRTAIELGVRVVPIPGAVAFVNALVASGLPADSVFFGGFLPSKKGERRKRLDAVKDIPATLTFYETPHRIAAALSDCLDILGDRQAAVGRELTKLHEEVIRGSISSLARHFSSANSRGEFVLVIDRADENARAEDRSTQSLKERISQLEGEGLERKAALKQAAREFGLSRSEAYRAVQSESGK
ncbi:MAG: 16S rRNA (cytidine(1402)-2'-O)-methyltransferase [Blastocatellia bacterium]|nr:16S rRNA (cytidine(1402)-2'-O)-methyltransferase [Chloracidobacterium sp.]MBL8185926.1 16S rRNA (cytidine(1402)-2'-O)-methyltransferase [Blastocatellia bacterium]HRJ87332.1 16S rRNA (cytidine(1402)-2'-O)-methyltransferase [Pyrinomonadaceae bacterium]HRK51073.1 16S rRNA (cytidine(1402)-2'-O)-methyltransferase [Pyrinomonadaceae bacterium]